ncbi:MAG: phage/plasmid primase, P4 family [Clostridiales bacterium]|nr:phage/plasmid primase, P4 family [Clostridiales bacterium]
MQYAAREPEPVHVPRPPAHKRRVTTPNLPAGLEAARWCCWQLQERDGRPTKVPINPRTGGGAKSNDPNTFTDYPSACNALVNQGYTGLGLGLFDGLCAIDIDHCLTTGEGGALVPSDLAMDIIDRMESYTEISPSGTGVHILFRAPGLQWDKARFYLKNPENGVEVYIAGQTNRYMTFTGAAWPFALPVEERSAAVLDLAERYMVRSRGNDSLPPPPPVPAGPADPLDDETLLRRARNAKNGARFSALWSGDAAGFRSGSEADLALCNLLAFWTGRDAARMDSLFRRSGLMRKKWDRRQAGTTYGAITIQKAIEGCNQVYEPQGSFSPAPGPGKSIPKVAKRDVSTEVGPMLRPPDLSDAGNAEVFVAHYRGRLIYVDALGWLWWNGQRWERSDHKALTWAIELSERMLKDAGRRNREALAAQADAQAQWNESGDDGDKARFEDAKAEAKKAAAYLKHAKNLRGAARLKNMLELARPALVLPADELDANPFDLNTPAGIINLTDGRLRPHEREAHCSQITEASPGNQEAELWQDFLCTVTQGDVNVARFLQAVAGMALIGAVYQEGIVIAYGGGRNGKSTFFNALGRVLGDYSGSIDIQVLTTERQNRGASLASLRGKRLVVTGELEEHQRLSVATLKKIASTDTLVIEEKYHQPETVKQSHTLVLFTNHLPRVGSTDNGTWRRLLVAPFPAVIPPGKGIQNYADVLAEQAGGAILAWAIEGAVRFVRNGFRLDIPDAVAEATEAYREREDWLNNFLTERCIRDPRGRAPAGQLYQDYRTWAASRGEHIRRQNEFDAALEAQGFQKIRPKNRKTWVGLKIDPSIKYENLPYYGGNSCDSTG